MSYQLPNKEYSTRQVTKKGNNDVVIDFFELREVKLEKFETQPKVVKNSWSWYDVYYSRSLFNPEYKPVMSY